MIRDDLLLLRTLIANGASAAEASGVAARLGGKLDEVDGPLRTLLLDAVETCAARLAAGDREGALRNLQLVHNLPVDEPGLDGWDTEE